VSKVKVLVVFANPRTTNPLRLGTEDRAIQQAIRRSRYRDNIEVTRCHAATIHDVRQSLLDEAFQVVHISGHGSNNGLVLEDDLGNEKVIPQKALAALFKVYSPPLQCVILNACYSISQGKLVSLGVPFTIAMEGPIDDEGAIEFSHGFYDAIGAGRAIDFAYREGQRTVALSVPNAQFISKILKKRAKNPQNAEDFSFMVRNVLPEEPSLSSDVVLIDASLDPSESPYEETTVNGKKQIRYKNPSTDRKGVGNDNN
jgi:hypothetical protein